MISVEHWNVRGLQDHKKRSSVFNHIRLSQNDIFVLSETHTDYSLASEFSYALWPHRSIWTAFSSASAGVAIIVLNKNLQVSEIVHCIKGSFITAEILCDSWFAPIYLTVVYIPSERKKRTEWISNTLPSIPLSENNIIIGDFNFVENQKDRISGKPGGGLHGAKEFSLWSDLNSFIDPWTPTSNTPCTSFHSTLSLKRKPWSARLD